MKLSHFYCTICIEVLVLTQIVVVYHKTLVRHLSVKIKELSGSILTAGHIDTAPHMTREHSSLAGEVQEFVGALCESITKLVAVM